jgi:DNA-binding NtrC family response regulator
VIAFGMGSYTAADVIKLPGAPNGLWIPDGTGLEVEERIRSKRGSAPIIIISVYDPSAIALRAEQLRISNFLQKPFSHEALRDAVKKAIDASPATRPLPRTDPKDPKTNHPSYKLRFEQSSTGDRLR